MQRTCYHKYTTMRKYLSCQDVQDKRIGSFNSKLVRNLYVDDGILPTQTVQETVDVIMISQRDLAEKGNLKLYKIALNSLDLINHIPHQDLSHGFRTSTSVMNTYHFTRAIDIPRIYKQTVLCSTYLQKKNYKSRYYNIDQRHF